MRVFVKMKTSGVQRADMARTMNVEEYLNVVVKALSMEFGTKVLVENISEDEILIVMDNYEVQTSMVYINGLSKPYGIDKFILQSFENQGLKFDINKSHYIQCCFGVYN
jgi:hypothetical protein